MPIADNVYLVDAQLFEENEWNKVIVFVYAENADIAKNISIAYQQKQQLRLSYQLAFLPINIYFQRHADEALINTLKNFSQALSETNPFLIFKIDEIQANEKSATPCLTKTEFKLRTEDEYSPFTYQPVPLSLKSLLWQDDIESHSYAIINASTSFWFPNDFQIAGIRSECLFKDEKYEKIGPYLLNLPKDSVFLEKLCSEPLKPEKDVGAHWHKNFGFLFTSSASFDELLHHFRRFIYMDTYDERLLYFRFYDPLVLENYFDFLQYHPKKLSTFWGHGLIESFLLPKKENVIYYQPNVDFLQIDPAKKQFDKFEMDAMIARKDEKLLLSLIQDILDTTPDILNFYSQDIVEKAVRHCANIAKHYGLKETRTIGVLALYSLACGMVIDILDPEKIIIKILEGNYSEQEKLALIQDRLSILEQQGIITNKFGESNE